MLSGYYYADILAILFFMAQRYEISEIWNNSDEIFLFFICSVDNAEIILMMD